jgi:hypothetical protein
MVRTMRFMALVWCPVSSMEATLPSSGITDNEEEVELGLPWTTDGGGGVHGRMRVRRWILLLINAFS